MKYHKITYQDLLSVAEKEEKKRLEIITDIYLLKTLALRWCQINRYKLGGYLGHSRKEGNCWDAMQNM